MRVFFYGTLMDADVRRVVLGRAVAVEPALLTGFRRVRMAGRCYPVVVRDAGATVAGLLASRLDRRALARLVEYEGPEYDLAVVTVATVSGRHMAARIFVAGRDARTSREAWALAPWQARKKARFIRELRR